MNLESKVGSLVLEYIERVRRNQLTEKTKAGNEYSIIRYSDNSYQIGHEDFILSVEFEYTKTEIEPEQVGDWFTPSYPAVVGYQITTESATVTFEDGTEKHIPITKNIERLTAEVVSNLVD